MLIVVTSEGSESGLSSTDNLCVASNNKEHLSESTQSWLRRRPSTPPSSKAADVFLNNGST